ncbi:hypothetical protein C8J57DRAFT_1225190 [Mycena rebaudengoi]|nr:hypothetical protein C8J57DRAFT_1225190 [Mycena rebaudengoi]
MSAEKETRGHLYSSAVRSRLIVTTIPAIEFGDEQLEAKGGTLSSISARRCDMARSKERILKSFNFDPKELCGIGIQIQKLEAVDAKASITLQTCRNTYTRFSLKKLFIEPKKYDFSYLASFDGVSQYFDGINRPPPRLIVLPPPPIHVAPTHDEQRAESSNNQVLPAIEDVDSSVLDSLPLEIRQELAEAWGRRSESPFPLRPAAAPPVVPIGHGPPGARSAGHSVFPQRKSAQPTGLQQIAPRLAPRSGGRGKTLDKNSLHPNRPPNRLLRPTDADLRDLDIDPEVFAALPRNVKSEQLTAARMIQNGGIPVVSGERLDLRVPRKYLPPPDLFRQPPPQAKYPDPPQLRQQGKEKGEKLFFSETDDVQSVIETWVNSFKCFPPNAKDVEFFAKFLLQSVDSARSTDTGVERAVFIVKWWLVLLRRYWGPYEHFEDMGGEAEDAAVADAWWTAFRDVKERLDIVAPNNNVLLNPLYITETAKNL